MVSLPWRYIGTWCAFYVAVTLPFTAKALAEPGVQASVPSDDIEQSTRAISLRPAYVDCIRGGAMTTPGMLACADIEFAFQDKRLNRAYAAAMSALGVAERHVLRNEERKWLSFKARKCALPEGPGSTDHVIAADCDVTETATRATLLDQRLPRWQTDNVMSVHHGYW
jgi:uncharacterized protein YecT (DUF1311 family)